MNDSLSNTLSVRIVTADYYLTKPISQLGDACYSGFRSMPIYHVPVIRIFGSTSEGIKTCAHIHGVFPYIFIPSSDDIQEKDLYQLATSLDKVINSSFAYNNSKSSHVYKITKVSGRPFYGYHEHEKEFLKIEFFNPAIVKRATDLLQNGAVNNTVFQPHEAHVPYILQFFIDNNLYGMSNITFTLYYVRADEHLVAPQMESKVPKQSYCKLEVDVAIGNLCIISSNDGNAPNNPGLAFIWEEEKKRRRLQDRTSQITPNVSQRRNSMSTNSEQYFKKKLLDKLHSLNESHVQSQSESETENDSILNCSYEELNTQSRSILEMLQELVNERNNQVPNHTEAAGPSTNRGTEEPEDMVSVSSLSSQPLFRLDAENDSILGDQFSDEENELDDNDHYVLSQTITYAKDESISSDDSDSEKLIGNIPQLDGANELPSNKNKKSKKPKNSESSKKSLKPVTLDLANVKETKSAYNLRSHRQPNTETSTFKPTDFKIILSRADHKSSPKKNYPRLNIDTQKSPKITHPRATEPKRLKENELHSPSTSTINEPDSKRSGRRAYPQLKINIKKSPKAVPLAVDTRILKRRRIDFAKDKAEESDSRASAESTDSDVTYIISKWKSSLKSKRKSDSAEGTETLEPNSIDVESTPLPDTEINSQKYSLRIKSYSEGDHFKNLCVSPELLESGKDAEDDEESIVTSPGFLSQLSSVHEIVHEKIVKAPANICDGGNICDSCENEVCDTFMGQVPRRLSQKSSFFTNEITQWTSSQLMCFASSGERSVSPDLNRELEESEALIHYSSEVVENLDSTHELCIEDSPKTREIIPLPPSPEYPPTASISACNDPKEGNQSTSGPNKSLSFNFNNSMWESVGDTYDENQIKSFYEDASVSPDITIVSSNNTDNSSPVTNSLDSTEIISFYGSQSPVSSIHANTELDKLSQSTDKSDDIVESSQLLNKKLPKAVAAQEGSSPTTSSTANITVLHSTPKGAAASKKSPSPTCTPILKKLMLKKFSEKSVKRKSKISSQRFQSEPFLPNIQEEDEKKDGDDLRNVSFSLPTMELSVEKDEIVPSKSQNISHSSSCSGPSFQIDGVTLANSGGFRMDLENLKDVKANIQYQFITVMSMEIFVCTRSELNPDPEFDPVSCLFYTVTHDAPNTPKLQSGIIIVNQDDSNTLDFATFNCEKVFVKNENELFNKFIEKIRNYDPDIFVGYEVEMLSWGYFIQRGHCLGRNCAAELSRFKEIKDERQIISVQDKKPEDAGDYSSDLKLIGRITLNIWRLMRHEVALQSYTFENMLYHVLHQRAPKHSLQFLTKCWGNLRLRWIVIDYYLLRVECNLKILDQLDFVGRTSELAKLFGIQFYEVLSRGSQFRVESMMLRLAKKQNYVAVSPSVKQRASMRAPESLPLIMEPESKFYTDPVIVLDFQSLYPSIIIAYNYCFSTCLGRMEYLADTETFRFGCVELTVPVNLIRKLESSLNISPAGVAFVDKSVRVGILPAMLEEILETRLMVKKSLKENKDNSVLKRVLHARQLGLKLIANVTYGYTSANFSGRMPCMEIGDSVVSKGRETLERAIKLVSETKRWGAKVVYGDTDSLFVLVSNRTKEEAFKIGSEIADAVTDANPKPVKLKLEKVYLPCILQTKKRYCGYMYESVNQEKPVYDAKGIETVRRDGCPAISKILEKSLKLLFETKKVDVVKQYVQHQFSKLISGRLSIQELTFAREYRGMNNYKEAACVPALQLAKQALLKDRRAEPRIKERVRYVLVAGPPGVPLIRLVRTPDQFLSTPGSMINAEYYITRAIIPALDRCFSLINVNVLSWYSELPRKYKISLPRKYDSTGNQQKKNIISHYFSSNKCVLCAKLATCGVCKQCERKPQRLALTLGNMVNSWQRKQNYVSKVCGSCCGRSSAVECISLDCPMFYIYKQSTQETEQVSYIEELQYKYLRF